MTKTHFRCEGASGSQQGEAGVAARHSTACRTDPFPIENLGSQVSLVLKAGSPLSWRTDLGLRCSRTVNSVLLV